MVRRATGPEGGRRKVALATCDEMPDLGEEGALLIEALERSGVNARAAIWNDTGIEWGEFDLVVVRATWDYIWRRDEFVAWASAVPRLANPADVLSWNTDKTYLGALAAAGIPVIPTRFFAPVGEDILSDVADLPPGELVVKPAVSAGALDTSLYGPSETLAAAEHVRALQLEGRTALVQPYRDQVDEEAETGLVYLGGDFSHGLRKESMLRDEPASIPGRFRQMVVSARTPSDAERRVAEAVLDAVPGGRNRLLYARVDLLPGPDGPELIELELTEPALYFSLDDGSADRFASAILGWIDASSVNS